MEFILFLVLCIAYFLPVILAAHRGCKNFAGIAIVSVLLGWTVLGWVGGLAWAACDQPEAKKEVEVAD
jgi:hypothetical protein